MDPVHFTGREILEMALRIEENGLRYYTDAGRAAKTRKLKDLFTKLAEEEGAHIKIFTGLKKLAPDDAGEELDPYSSEAPLYLRALADTEVFTKPEEGKKLAARARDEKDALTFAIEREKDSILFYYELKNMIREKDRSVIDNLIEQEKGHYTKLTALQKELFG